MSKLSLIIFTVLLGFGSSLASAQVPEGQEYIIQADDWLSKIAEKTYGDPLAFPIIVEATNNKAAEDNSFAIITNPDIIEIGQKVWVPVMTTDGPETATGGSQLTLEQLKNGIYSGVYEEPVTLIDGLYEGEPFVEGGASRPTLLLVDELIVFGDLNSDGVDDAAVLLAENSGGSGVFTYVASVLNQAGQPVNTGAVLLGDRTQIKSMVVQQGQIVLEVVTQGPDDPMCCPTSKVRTTYALQNDQVVEVGAETLGAVSVQDLSGTSWLLDQLDFNQPPLADGPITASFIEGQVSGSAGCNTYSAAVSSDSGQALAIGPAAATKKACLEPLMNQETQYLIALQGARQWSYFNGNLALPYQGDDGSVGTLVFVPE